MHRFFSKARLKTREKKYKQTVCNQNSKPKYETNKFILDYIHNKNVNSIKLHTVSVFIY